jgi:meiotically up-regulated gene 157 (Mug157) protein
LPADSGKQIARYAVFKKDQEQLRDMLIEVARRAEVLTLDPYSMICKNDKCERFTENGIALFKDSSHFNPDWATKHASYIDISIEPYIKTI